MVLLAALALSFGVGDYVEGSVIAAVIVLNTTYVPPLFCIPRLMVFSVLASSKSTERKKPWTRYVSSPLQQQSSSVVVRVFQFRPRMSFQVCSFIGTLFSVSFRRGDLVLIKVGDVVPADVSLGTLDFFLANII